MTPQEAKAAGLVPVTEKECPSIKIETAYGEVLWSEWCKREVQRFLAAGRVAKVIEHEGKTLAVWATPKIQPQPTKLPLPG